MIEVFYRQAEYVVKNGTETLGFFDNIYEALEEASKRAEGKGFMINCDIPSSPKGGVTKTFYTCTKCGYGLRIYGSVKMNAFRNDSKDITINTTDLEDYSKEVYAYCGYCDIKYIIIFMLNKDLSD